MAQRAPAWLVMLAVVLTPSNAAADDPMPSNHLRLTSGPGTLHVGDRDIVLPKDTHILAPIAWDMLDAEVRRLQDREVRLDAENRSLRKSAASWQPGWKTIAAAVVSGISIGVYAARKW